MTKLAACIVLMALTFSARAITWVDVEVDDPILEGARCKVHEPASWGSYIYNWPSKYDQVFWPLTEQYGIWFCEKSGFTAFIGGFSDLDSTEITKIRAYLAQNPPKDDSIETKLALLKAIYSFRNVDKNFNNRLLRVLARWQQDLGNINTANEYRREALAEIELALATELDEYQNIEYLYLAASYSKLLGNQTNSDTYLSKLILALDNITREENKDYADYIRKLYPDIKNIKAGGALDPEKTE